MASKQPPRQVVGQVNSNDVLLGRGATIASHDGNVKFRALVEGRRQEYGESVSLRHKQEIALQIYEEIGRCDGRFLENAIQKTGSSAGVEESQVVGGTSSSTAPRPSAKEETWVEVEKRVALEKIKQGLRERSSRDTSTQRMASLRQVSSQTPLPASIHMRDQVMVGRNQNGVPGQVVVQRNDPLAHSGYNFAAHGLQNTAGAREASSQASMFQRFAPPANEVERPHGGIPQNIHADLRCQAAHHRLQLHSDATRNHGSALGNNASADLALLLHGHLGAIGLFHELNQVSQFNHPRQELIRQRDMLLEMRDRLDLRQRLQEQRLREQWEREQEQQRLLQEQLLHNRRHHLTTSFLSDCVERSNRMEVAHHLAGSGSTGGAASFASLGLDPYQSSTEASALQQLYDQRSLASRHHLAHSAYAAATSAPAPLHAVDPVLAALLLRDYNRPSIGADQSRLFSSLARPQTTSGRTFEIAHSSPMATRPTGACSNITSTTATAAAEASSDNRGLPGNGPDDIDNDRKPRARKRSQSPSSSTSSDSSTGG